MIKERSIRYCYCSFTMHHPNFSPNNAMAVLAMVLMCEAAR